MTNPSTINKEPRIKIVSEYKEFKNEDGFKDVKKAEIADYYVFKKKQEKGVHRKKANEDM